MFYEFTSKTTDWHTDLPIENKLFVRHGQIIAFRGYQNDGNNALLYIAQSSVDGWLEFPVVETVEKIKAAIAVAEGATS